MNWIKEVKSDIRAVKTDRKELVKFGLVVGPIFIVLAFLFGRHTAILLTVGSTLVLGGLISPKILRFPYIGWMSFAVILGFFVFRILLVVLYFAVIMPMGLIGRIFRGDFLSKSFKHKKESYWVKHQDQSSPENPY